MSQVRTILASLKQEKANLDGQVSRLSAAIDALAGVSRAPKKKGRKKAVRKAAKTAPKKRKPMTAAHKKLVSARMKEYWAARRKK